MRQKGFTLLEVLVAIVVLSIGLLGMAGLIASSMRNNQIAYYRSVATQQTMDMADRMRANLAGVRGVGGVGDYDALAAIIPAAANCVAVTCTVAQMAVYDHAQWNTANSRLLPGGVGTVASTPPGGFLITMMWTEKDMGGASDPGCPAGTPANTRCFLTRFTP